MALVWLGCGSSAVTFERAGRCEPALSVNGSRCPSFAECTAKVGDVVTLASTAGCEAVSILGTGCTEPLACTLSRAETVKISGRVRLVVLSIALPPNEGEVAYAGTGVQGACSSDCSVAFDYADQVTLIAKAGAGFRFVGFTGEGCGANATCQFTLDQPRTVSAAFTREETRRLTVTTTPAGAVRSTPAAIDCRADGGTCAADFPKGSQVTLTAEPAPAAVFRGWSGVLCDQPACAVTLDTDITVGATFHQAVSLSLAPSRATDGGVRVNGALQALPYQGIFDAGATVELFPELPGDETIRGWVNITCQEQNPRGRCTTVVNAQTTATLEVHPFVTGLVGGWHGGVQHVDSTALDAGTLAMLATVDRVTSLFEPAFDAGGVPHDVVLELALDGGLLRRVRGTGEGSATSLTQSSRGVVAMGFARDAGVTVTWANSTTVLDAGQIYAVPLAADFAAQPIVATPHAITSIGRGEIRLESIGDDVVLMHEFESNLVFRFSSNFDASTAAEYVGSVAGLPTPNGHTVNFFDSMQPGSVSLACNAALSTLESALTTLTGPTSCSAVTRIPGIGNLATRNSLSGTWSRPLLTQIANTNGVPRLRVDAFDATNTKRWETPLLVAPTTQFSLRDWRWRSLGTRLVSAISAYAQGPFTIAFEDGAAVACKGTSAILVALDATSGKPTWMHCVPLRNNGVEATIRALHVVNDRVVLILDHPGTTEGSYRIGSWSLPTAPRTTVVMILQPPSP